MRGIITILGTGAWGTTLAQIVAEQGYQVRIWSFEPEVAREINNDQENKTFLPGIKLNQFIYATSDLADALKGADAVISTVISRGLRSVMVDIAKRNIWPEGAPCLTASKGLEPDSNFRMSEVIQQELGLNQDHIAVLSGPNLAAEIARGALASAVIAAKKRDLAEYFQSLLMCSYFRIYSSPDVIGVELGGALKNVIAIAAGICDGMQLSDNTKAALVTRGLAEITRLGVRMGAEARTFAGLSGIGDLMVTCNSKLSRNYSCGYQLGQGKTYEEILASSRSVIEGARTVIAFSELGERFALELPIGNMVYDILYRNQPIGECIQILMQRLAKPEHDEQATSW